MSFQSERELAGADFHRRKDRAFQGTHNNICERAIRPVVMGRKAWLCVSRRRTDSGNMKIAA
ncbi:transposase [Escherichia coli]|uniref:IS66 family transposase n=1 Tax=Escherichia coli TaxID=562 RepID=UPI00396720EC